MKCLPRQITIGHLFSHRSEYDLEPPYQRRGGIWTKAQRQLLIDSVLGGFDVPKLYIHEDPWHSPDKRFAVADGKQRLLTLWGFMDNDFPISDNFSLVDSHNLPYGSPRPGSYYRDLPSQWADHFAGFNLDVVIIQTPKSGANAERLIREIFTRLNSGSALSAGEKARARAGSLLDLAREIATHKFITEHVSISTKRGEDMLLAQNLVAMEVSNAQRGTLVCDRTPPRLRDLMTLEDAESKSLADVVEEQIVNRLNDLCGFFSPSDPLLKKRTLIDGYVCLIDWAAARTGSGGVNPADLRNFIIDFEHNRKSDPDEQMLKYSALARQGTNNESNLRDRVAILSKKLVEFERSRL